MTSTIARAIIVASLLVSGCYSSAVVTEEDPDPKDRTVIFSLKDGSSITSRAGQHQRTDYGYQVVGTLHDKHDVNLGEYAGALQDSQIAKVTAYKYNGYRGGTAFLVTVAVVAGVIAIAVLGGKPVM